jgi:hypothetical protein
MPCSQPSALTIFDLTGDKSPFQTLFRGKFNIFAADVTPDGEHVLIEDRFVKTYLPRTEKPAASSARQGLPA